MLSSLVKLCIKKISLFVKKNAKKLNSTYQFKTFFKNKIINTVLLFLPFSFRSWTTKAETWSRDEIMNNDGTYNFIDIVEDCADRPLDELNASNFLDIFEDEGRCIQTSVTGLADEISRVQQSIDQNQQSLGFIENGWNYLYSSLEEPGTYEYRLPDTDAHISLRAFICDLTAELEKLQDRYDDTHEVLKILSKVIGFTRGVISRHDSFVTVAADIGQLLSDTFRLLEFNDVFISGLTNGIPFLAFLGFLLTRFFNNEMGEYTEGYNQNSSYGKSCAISKKKFKAEKLNKDSLSEVVKKTSLKNPLGNSLIDNAEIQNPLRLKR